MEKCHWAMADHFDLEFPDFSIRLVDIQLNGGKMGLQLQFQPTWGRGGETRCCCLLSTGRRRAICIGRASFAYWLGLGYWLCCYHWSSSRSLSTRLLMISEKRTAIRCHCNWIQIEIKSAINLNQISAVESFVLGRRWLAGGQGAKNISNQNKRKQKQKQKQKKMKPDTIPE